MTPPRPSRRRARRTGPSSSPGNRFQALGDLRRLGRSPLHSHLRRIVDDVADDTRRPLLAAFLPANLWRWMSSYLEYVFRPKHRFETYPPEGERGVYSLPEVCRVAVAGDWGTGTAESARIAGHMRAFDPDFTIHLGDVYYVGNTTEVRENCLGLTEYGYEGVTWPHGRRGSFALNGNHEMYAGGKAYFETFLPTLGIPGSRDGRQLASFFCLENEFWRVLGLDTAYNSVGIPVLELIPGINRLPHVGPDCRLEKSLLNWLHEVVRPREPERRRATVLLSHHQYFSAFEKAYPLPARQLCRFFHDQELLWIWGHEHRWAVYGAHNAGSLTAHGRCLGHGGMPVSLGEPKPSSIAAGMPLEFYDPRVYARDGKNPMGVNGFVNLQFEGRALTLDYRDVGNDSMLVERFVARENGGLARELLSAAPGLSRAFPGDRAIGA